ncbi:hypothetical protein ANCDUO_00792 [Ancylostoma duodenale]|uniref:Uncharacterized protein n=1 Tax=Ancylostoma duodenale TaxID=51022 RepID=A0A0C2E0P3_9BILA|nr:hypothetical protein ANCDUO_00792 [Ancylostoma duodenale]
MLFPVSAGSANTAARLSSSISSTQTLVPCERSSRAGRMVIGSRSYGIRWLPSRLWLAARTVFDGGPRGMIRWFDIIISVHDIIACGRPSNTVRAASHNRAGSHRVVRAASDYRAARARGGRPHGTSV